MKNGRKIMWVVLFCHLALAKPSLAMERPGIEPRYPADTIEMVPTKSLDLAPLNRPQASNNIVDNQEERKEENPSSAREGLQENSRQDSEAKRPESSPSSLSSERLASGNTTPTPPAANRFEEQKTPIASHLPESSDAASDDSEETNHRALQLLFPDDSANPAPASEDSRWASYLGYGAVALGTAAGAYLLYKHSTQLKTWLTWAFDSLFPNPPGAGPVTSAAATTTAICPVAQSATFPVGPSSGGFPRFGSGSKAVHGRGSSFRFF